MKKYMSILSLAAMALLISACQVNKHGEVDLSRYTPPAHDSIVFVHPCALYSAAQFANIRAKVEAGTLNAAAAAELEALKSNKYTTGTWGVETHVTKQIVRGDAKGTIEGKENYGNAMRDAASAQQFGLLWQLTRNEEYAKKGVTILNAWAAGCDEVTSADANQVLAAGAQGFVFALAAEELRDYNGWSESKQEEFKIWIKQVFATKNLDFLMYHARTSCGSAKHYWSNWDLVNLCSYLQIGILCEDKSMVDFATTYYASGAGNGAIKNFILHEHTDPLYGERIAQAQESGRDQGHATMSVAVAIQLCQAAAALYENNNMNESLNLYALNDNALLKGAEYVAMTNYRKGNGISQSAFTDGDFLLPDTQIPFSQVGPFCTHSPQNVVETVVSIDGRGAVRPNWEMLLAYCKRAGLTDCRYTEMTAAKIRPECGPGDVSRYGDNSGAFDQIGWSTLMCYSE